MHIFFIIFSESVGDFHFRRSCIEQLQSNQISTCFKMLKWNFKFITQKYRKATQICDKILQIKYHRQTSLFEQKKSLIKGFIFDFHTNSKLFFSLFCLSRIICINNDSKGLIIMCLNCKNIIGIKTSIVNLIFNQRDKMKGKYCSVSVKSTSLLTCLSISTMCLLIYASIVIITVISITPIIILGLGQINAGQRDIILTPVSQQQSYINTTKISELSEQVAMPRLRTRIGVNDKYAIGWFMDFDLELQQHLGTLEIIPQPNQQTHYIYMHSQFGFDIGDSISVSLREYQALLGAIKNHLEETMQENYEQIIRQIDLFLDHPYFMSANFTVIQTYDLAMGKFAIDASTGTSYMNISSGFKHIVSETYKNNKINGTYFLQYVKEKLNLGDYSTECTINIPNRIQVYSDSDYQKTYNTLSQFGANILNKIGLFSVSSEIPIADNLEQMSYFGMFIGVILKLIIISLFTLSILMMNNMLNIGIERKSFDFAVIKTMGANRIFVIINLLIDSLKYVIISNLVAFPFAYLSLTFISNIFVNFFGYHYNVEPSFGAIIGGFFIGVLVPIISSVAPIWGVINNDLAENLNPVRNKTQSIKTDIYIQGAEFPVGKFLFGIIATVFGLMIYYLLPKGMINKDISLLLFVFFSILVGLLLGLILLSYSFQYLFEKLVAYITLFWANKTDFQLTMKNLSAHRIKNRRTSLLYALSVSMVIFVSVGLSIQMQTIAESMLSKHGTYLQVRSYSGSINKPYYDRLFAEKFPDQIKDWAYQTIPLHQYVQNNRGVTNVMLSDKAKMYFKETPIYAVSPNFLKVMPNYDTISLTQSIAYEPYDPYSFLYTHDGYMTCTMSQFLAKKFNVLNSNNNQFLINAYQQQSVQRIKMNVSTVLNKRAGLAYSKFGFGRHQVGISFDTFLNLAGLRSYDQIPYSKIKLQVADPKNTQQLANKIRNQIMMHNLDWLWDYSEVEGTIDQINDLLQKILTILLVLVLLISFFSLVTTSYINIINQSTQIAILMTLGYTKIRIVKIYIYEAFVLVLNSCLIGVAVGAFVAWMMGLQRQLFGDFPVKIQIQGIWVIGVAAIVSSILSTIKPIRDIFNRSISQVFQYS